MNHINKELNKVAELLLLEKEEDLKQYKLKMANTSISERRKEGICWYPVNIERTKYSSGERLLVIIKRPENHKESHIFQSGKLVSIFSNAGNNSEIKNTVSGVINTVKKQEMVITLNSDAEPDWLHDGNVGVQLLFDENAYFEMMRALNIVINTEDDKLEQLKATLVGSEEPSFLEEEAVVIPTLNSSQNEAVNSVLNAEQLAILHGPPGTGKTTTLVEAITQTLKKEPQVMVCAPSNAAVDLLVEKLTQKNIKVVRVGHPARITDEILDLCLDAKIANHNSYKDLRAVKKQADEYRRQAQKYKRNFGPEEREQRKLLLKESSRLKDEADHLEHYIINDVLSSAQVIACTLVGASNYQIRDKKYSTVFIDEAGQGLEPATWIPITKADKIVFAGDHFQLPPTIKSIKAAKEGLSETLFEKVIKRNSCKVLLKEQYRMNHQIMQFSSEEFYDNQLIANSDIKEWTLFDDDLPVEFIDTAGCGFFEQVDKESKSTFNPEEADLLKKHFLQFTEILATQNHSATFSAGIISPYKAQVNVLQNIFEGYDNDIIKYSINTIDSFQGQEKDIIYISLARCNEKGEIGFLSDIRRMNVAMTRARKKLVIIGDSATIGNHKFYANFLDYINKIGAYKSAYEYLY